MKGEEYVFGFFLKKQRRLQEEAPSASCVTFCINAQPVEASQPSSDIVYTVNLESCKVFMNRRNLLRHTPALSVASTESHFQATKEDGGTADARTLIGLSFFNPQASSITLGSTFTIEVSVTLKSSSTKDAANDLRLIVASRGDSGALALDENIRVGALNVGQTSVARSTLQSVEGWSCASAGAAS